LNSIPIQPVVNGFGGRNAKSKVGRDKVEAEQNTFSCIQIT